MRRNDDPLEGWLIQEAFGKLPDAKKRVAEVRTALAQLDKFLANPPAKRPHMLDVARLRWIYGVTLAPDDLALAQKVYQRVVEVGGTGSAYVQEDLLNLIAATPDPASIAFWLELLDLVRPRDSFAARRRTMALAALARLAISANEPAAYDGLRRAAHHDNPEVRALAVHYWGEAYLQAERPLPPDVVTDLLDIAVHDRVFAPRFQARAVLRDAMQSVPLDNPDGVYAFKVSPLWDKRIHRTIELKSKQTLDHLHSAIQRSIKWDSDHLYSFYMKGTKHDELYAFACPYEEDRPHSTDEAVIGELGLSLRHKFLYHFDYGDNRKFEVQVVAIRPMAEPGEYPRVAGSQGRAPEQYSRW